MKILQFMTSDFFGGAEKVFVELSSELSKNHEVITLVIRNTQYIKSFSKRVHVHSLLANPTSHSPLFSIEIYKVIKTYKPDIVHTHGAKASMLINRLQPFLKIKHLATKHNARKGKIFNRLKWVSAISKLTAQSIKPKQKSNISIIYNGIKKAPLNLDTNNLPDTFKILAIGRLDKIKGFDILINQVAKLNFPFQLEILGDGPEHLSLLKQIKQLKLENKVHLKGFCNSVAEKMHNSHLIVVSSHSEGGPLIIPEALFYGHCIISTPVGISPEILPPPFICEQHSMSGKIIDIFHNYDQYNSSFEKIKNEKAENFLLEKTATEYEKLYSKILGST